LCSVQKSVEIKKATRCVRSGIERAVWKRDGGQCTYRDAKTDRRCESRYALEMEHVRPFSQGGEATIENLTLLCPAHNQLAAIHAYGLLKMQGFWKI
jgi:5-methylcytosine-specific restriction endonuclease McrA